MPSEHTLYIVATPIGHRADLSIRAIEILQGVSCIYAEDTRHSLPLMQFHGIRTRLSALHEHNESQRAAAIIEHLKEVGSAALITDAGTPLISDPGFRLVSACHAAGVRVSPVPGACAVTAALSVSGLPTDRFLFVGFPPAKSGARQRWYARLASEPQTLVLYESPHRIVDSLSDLAESVGPDRQITVARELTKRFETLLRGSVSEVLQQVQADSNQQRGEFVLVVASAEFSNSAATSCVRFDEAASAGISRESGDSDEDVTETAAMRQATIDVDRLILLMLNHMPVKHVARQAADLTGLPRKAIYDRALQLQGR